MPQVIIQYSVQRTGSNLITQILRQLFPTTRVSKTHKLPSNDVTCPIVMTYRDFRDVLVSGWRVYNNIPLKELDNGRQLPIGQINKELKWVIEGAQNMEAVRRVHGDHLLMLQYEKFINDYDYIFDNLESFFNITIDDEQRKRLRAYSSLETNTKRSKKFATFRGPDNYDKKTGIHGLHIYRRGQPGTWKNIVPADAHDLINKSLKRHLVRWGYEE